MTVSPLRAPPSPTRLKANEKSLSVAMMIGELRVWAQHSILGDAVERRVEVDEEVELLVEA